MLSAIGYRRSAGGCATLFDRKFRKLFTSHVEQILQRLRAQSQENQGLPRGNRLATARLMSRDYTKLRVFQLADQLVLDVYSVTHQLPDSERYGLQSQIRRAAVSVPTNIVEGSVRRTDKAYLRYLETSLGSACEARYLVRLCVRLHLLKDSSVRPLEEQYTAVIKQMESLMAKVAATARSRRRLRVAAPRSAAPD